MALQSRAWTAPHNGAGIEVLAVQWILVCSNKAIPEASAAPELYGPLRAPSPPLSTMGSVLAREQCRCSGGARLVRRLAWLLREVCWIASIADAVGLGLGIAISVIVGPCGVSASTSRGGVRLPRRLAWPWQAQEDRLAIYPA
ncbi:hypothetical protein JB92DRAFT_3141971 [Gautieria morchelliformis]|nr:hypothetical protein JB92DRAFT_3141971 [Gautieria morchelliformis]